MDWGTMQIPAANQAPAASPTAQPTDWGSMAIPSKTQAAAIHAQTAPGMAARALSDVSGVLSHVHPFGFLPSMPNMDPTQAQDVISNKIPAALYGAVQSMPGIQQLMGKEPGQEAPIADLVNQASQAAQQQNPNAYKGGQVLGSTALGLLGGGAGEAAGAEAAGRAGLTGIKALLAKSIPAGAGAMALPNPTAGQSRLGNAVTGAVSGAVLPIAAIGAGKVAGGARTLGSEAMDYLKGFTDAGRREELGNKLFQLAGNQVPELQAPPLPGMRQTLGQATNAPGILALEHGAFKTAPGAAAYSQIKNVNNQAMMKAASEVAPNVNPDQVPNLSSNLADSLAQAKAAADAHEHALWQAVDPANALHFPKQNLLDAVKDTVQKLGPVRSQAIPAEFGQMVDSLPNNIPLMVYKDLRGYVGNLASKYANQGDANSANALGTLFGSLTDNMANLPVRTAAAKIMPASEANAIADRFNAARQFSAQKHSIFSQNPLGSLFRTDSTGAQAVEPVAVGQKLLNATKPSGIEQANKAFDIGNVPEGKKNLATTLVSKILNDSSTGELDSAGNRMISGTRLAKSLRVNNPLIEKAIPNQTAKVLLKQIGKAAEMNDRVQSAVSTGNSTTPLDLSSHRLIDDLMGRFVQPTPMESGLIGAVAGDAMKEGGAMPGYIAGRLGGGVLRRVSGKNAEKMQQLIYDAITNPAEGMGLLKAANQRNLNKLSPVFKKYWQPSFGVYGAEAGAEKGLSNNAPAS